MYNTEKLTCIQHYGRCSESQDTSIIECVCGPGSKVKQKKHNVE